jgi:hypothetical protein
LIKKAGVPFTPLRMPPIKSLRTLFWNWPVSRTFCKAASGRPSPAPIRKDCRDAQPALVFKEGIVHIPKQSGRAGEPSAFSGDLGVRVYFGQREMTENEPHASAKRQLDLVDDRICAPRNAGIHNRRTQQE